MRIQTISILTFIVLARPALCESVRANSPAGEQWFGVSAADFAGAGRFAGSPLRVKARFVRELTGGEEMTARRLVHAGDTRTFVVAAAGGEIVCEMSSRANCGAIVREMRRATPVMIHGTLDARRNLFLVDTIVQGWGRDQMEDGS